MEALPALCDAMQCCELYTRKDGAFRIRTGKTRNLLECITAGSVSVLSLRICATCRSCYIWLRRYNASISSRRLTLCRTPTACWVRWCLLNLHAQVAVQFSTICCLRNLSYDSYRSSAADTHTRNVISHLFPCLQLFVVLATLLL